MVKKNNLSSIDLKCELSKIFLSKTILTFRENILIICGFMMGVVTLSILILFLQLP